MVQLMDCFCPCRGFCEHLLIREGEFNYLWATPWQLWMMRLSSTVHDAFEMPENPEHLGYHLVSEAGCGHLFNTSTIYEHESWMIWFALLNCHRLTSDLLLQNTGGAGSEGMRRAFVTNCLGGQTTRTSNWILKCASTPFMNMPSVLIWKGPSNKPDEEVYTNVWLLTSYQ